jgi:hypothetical protein
MRIIAILLFLAAASRLAAAEFAPRHLYVTSEGEFDRTLTVTCHELGAAADATPVGVRFAPADAAAGAAAQVATGRIDRIPGLADARAIHHVRLDGLAPATLYRCQIGDDRRGWSAPFTIRTLPADDRPLTIVTGGDLGPWPPSAPLLAETIRRDPALLLIGGDLFYENGDVKQIGQVDGTFDRLDAGLRTADGRLIPLILGIGNHEVAGGWNKTPDQAPFFYRCFAQGGSATFRRQLGANAALYVLDSGHTTPIAGAQTDWLRERLAADQALPWRFACYHVPIYPSVRKFEPEYPALKLWAPLFDQFRLTAAFENHDHAFKRSKPLKAGVEAADGTLYLGDGAFGVGTRDPDPKRPYLAKVAKAHHLWQVDISTAGVTYRAFLGDGSEIDLVETKR